MFSIIERMKECFFNPIQDNGSHKSYILLKNICMFLFMPLIGSMILLFSKVLPPIMGYLLMSMQSVIIFVIVSCLLINTLVYLKVIKICGYRFIAFTLVFFIGLFGLNNMANDLLLYGAKMGQAIKSSEVAYQATKGENQGERLWVMESIICKALNSPNHDMINTCRLIDANDKKSFFELHDLKVNSLKNKTSGSKEEVAKENEIFNRDPLEIDPTLLHSRIEHSILVPTKENFLHIIGGAYNFDPISSYFNTLKK